MKASFFCNAIYFRLASNCRSEFGMYFASFLFQLVNEMEHAMEEELGSEMVQYYPITIKCKARKMQSSGVTMKKERIQIDVLLLR